MSFFKKEKKTEKEIDENPKDKLTIPDEIVTSTESSTITDEVSFNEFIPTIETLEKCRELLISNFQKAVDERYTKVYLADPTPFRMLQSENLELIYVHLDFKKSSANEDLAFLFYNPEKEHNVSVIIPTDEDYDEYYKYTIPSNFVLNVIKKKRSLNESDLIYTRYILKSFFKAQRLMIDEYLIEDFSNPSRIDDTIKSALKEYQTHVNKDASYYAKDAALYSYTLLDLKPIILKVNDEDFTYQLNEAIAAYDKGLYTASATVLGVTIETMCIQILKNNSQKVKDSDSTMIDRLADRLKENNLITRKEHGRLIVAYKVRNLAAHSSPGKTIQADCHFLISVIHDMVETHF